MSRQDDVQTLLQRLGYRSLAEALRAVQQDDTAPEDPKRRRPQAPSPRGPPDRLLRTNEVAEVLGVSVWTIYRYTKRGVFPKPIYLTANGPALWRVRDIDNFVEKRRTARRVPLKRGCLKKESNNR